MGIRAWPLLHSVPVVAFSFPTTLTTTAGSQWAASVKLGLKSGLTSGLDFVFGGSSSGNFGCVGVDIYSCGVYVLTYFGQTFSVVGTSDFYENRAYNECGLPRKGFNVITRIFGDVIGLWRATNSDAIFW